MKKKGYDSSALFSVLGDMGKEFPKEDIGEINEENNWFVSAKKSIIKAKGTRDDPIILGRFF